MTVPEAKSDPRLRRYDLRRLRLPVANGFVSMVVPDAAAWIRQGAWVPETERGSEPPYWVQVWPASVAVARLLTRFGSLAGLRVLDLGAGIGVPGVAAARCGATVTFADREADALAFASWNARRAAEQGAQPSCQELDWSRDLVQGQYDLVVLADVTYRPLHHRPLRRQLAAALAPGGVVVHADPLRREATDFLAGLRADFATAEGILATHFEDKRVAVRLCVASTEATKLDAWRPLLAAPARRTAAGPNPLDPS